MIDRARSVLKRHGLFGTLGVLVRKAQAVLREHSPERKRHLQEQLDFDRKYGVDTTTKLAVSSLDLEGPNAASAFGYQATGITPFLNLIRAFPISHADFTFVDLGCGKGRPLLLASHFPFRKVVGVEFSSMLAGIARKNVQNYRDPAQKCLDIEVVCQDASQYDPPPGNILIYMYNPFLEGVMLPALDRLHRAALAGRNRTIEILYVNPTLRHVMDPLPYLKVVSSEEDKCHYRIVP